MASRSPHPEASSADDRAASAGTAGAAPDAVVPLRGKGLTPDPRMIELVRLLARQAARDYHAESRRRVGRGRDGASPIGG